MSDLKYIRKTISMLEERAEDEETFKSLCDLIRTNSDKFKFHGVQPESTINSSSEFKEWHEVVDCKIFG